MTRDELRATPSITASQGAAFLGISVRSWYRLEQRGDLPTHRMPSLNCRIARWSGEELAKYDTPEDRRRRASAWLRKSA
jgi:predicted DNA-binding transcriptional regulator AlpA